MYKRLHKSLFLYNFIAYIHLTKDFRCYIIKLWTQLSRRSDISVRTFKKNSAYPAKAEEPRRFAPAWCFIQSMQAKKPFGKLKAFRTFGCSLISPQQEARGGRPPSARRGWVGISAWAFLRAVPPFAPTISGIRA